MLSIRELRDRAVIRPIKRAVEDQLLDLPGVTAVDIGEQWTSGRPTGQQVIVVSVGEKRPVGELPSGAVIPADVLGIPVDVVEETPELRHLQRGVDEPMASLEERFELGSTVTGGSGVVPSRPVHMAGVDGSTAGRYRRIGTLGVLVAGNEPAVVTMGLTTFDVACLDDGWSVGDRMVDPDGGRVYADLARAALSGRVDAAAVSLVPGVEYAYRIAGVGPVTGQAVAYPGELVRKSGYGTRVTEGTVTSTDTTVRVDHGEALGVRVLREQLRIDAPSPNSPFGGRGDAGAAVVNANGRVVGLLVADSCGGRTGFACPIADVLAELDVRLCVASQSLSV
ncbi:chymotrypsin family serine protease [Parasphingorhabdus pacifica]